MAELPHARAFVAEVNAVLPAGYRTVVEGDRFWVLSPDGGRAGTDSSWFTSDVLLADEAVENAVSHLHQIQQEIAEETTEPWPAQSGPAYTGFPEPDGELVGDELRLWFGDRAAPVLALQPIDLGAVILRE